MSKKTEPMPAGWGFAQPAKPEPNAQPSTGQFHDFDAGSFAQHAGNGLFEHFVQGEFVRQVELYEESGKVEHLWRAWRVARCMGELPARMLARLIPHLDAMAKEGHVAPSIRTTERENRDSALRSYYSLLELKQNPMLPWQASLTMRRIREMVAKTHNTTQGTVKTWVIEYERTR